jgi:hypothetical protein
LPRDARHHGHTVPSLLACCNAADGAGARGRVLSKGFFSAAVSRYGVGWNLCNPAVPKTTKRPTQLPTHECTFSTQNEDSCKNICSVFKEIAKAASFGTRKSQVQILPLRPPSNKVCGTEFHRYEFWVGSWVGGPRRPRLALPINRDELEPRTAHPHPALAPAPLAGCAAGRRSAFLHFSPLLSAALRR